MTSDLGKEGVEPSAAWSDVTWDDVTWKDESEVLAVMYGELPDPSGQAGLPVLSLIGVLNALYMRAKDQSIAYFAEDIKQRICWPGFRITQAERAQLLAHLPSQRDTAVEGMVMGDLWDGTAIHQTFDPADVAASRIIREDDFSRVTGWLAATADYEGEIVITPCPLDDIPS